MKKILIIFFCIITSVVHAEKQTTFDKNLFEKAQSDGKVVIISKYENQLMFLKKNLEEKPVSIISYINLQKIIKFNEGDKKVAFTFI